MVFVGGVGAIVTWCQVSRLAASARLTSPTTRYRMPLGHAIKSSKTTHEDIQTYPGIILETLSPAHITPSWMNCHTS